MCAALVGMACDAAFAQAQTENPGDINVIRDITPRVAYHNVPKDQDPVLLRVTTFPSNTFNPMMETMVSDVDLTNAHGSNGIAPDGMLGGAGMQAITRVLAGDAARGAIVHGAIGNAPASGGIGGTISSSITNAIVPLTSALGAAK
jgi:hypothetical protein